MSHVARQHVVAAVRTEEDLELVLQSSVKMVFLLAGDLCQLGAQCTRLLKARKQLFLHIDLLEGLKGDESGLRYLGRTFHPNGVISTRASTLKCARELGLLAIQRVFVLDHPALETGVQHARMCKPDFVEVLPGISPRIIRLAAECFDVPVIAGGLIESAEDVSAALDAGAVAVSSSRQELWGL